MKKEGEIKETTISNNTSYIEGFQTKTISNYFDELLKKYLVDESLSKNTTKFYFWRLCS